MPTTNPQLLEMLKTAAWQQAHIGMAAAESIHDALRIDDTPPRPLPTDDRVLPRRRWAHPSLTPAQEARNLVRKPVMSRRTRGVWAGTQLLLVAAGNVSKLLWPPRGDCSGHAADLRALLGVTDEWRLRDRQMRNSFEHFGERIIDWASDHTGQRYSDGAIGNGTEAPREDELPLPIRQFHPETFSVSCLGNVVSLEPLETELREIAHRASPESGLHLES